MKKILLLATTAVLALTSCGDLDINESPNNPGGSNVTAKLIMPAVQSAIATVTGDGLYNPAGFFVQYFDQNPTANQYNNLTYFHIEPSDQLIDRSYAISYAYALQDIEEIKNKTNNTADLFVATVLRAYTFQLMVDATGETPCSEALGSIQKPKYDDGKDVYAGVLKEIDDAEAALNESQDMMETTDLMCDGDIDQWKGFANALRLRMYLRMIQGGVDAAAYTEKVKALVSANEFFSGNIEFAAYSDKADKRNPWCAANAYNLNAKNHVAAIPIISYMELTNDPRIAYTFVKATEGDNAGQYYGRIPGSHKQPGFTQYDNIGYFSALNYYPTKPVEFFTQAELQLLLAECYIKYFNNTAAAQTAYETAIRTDFAQRGISGADAFLAGNRISFANAASNDDKLKLIYMQKWVALLYMDHMEAWSEMRRTNCPEYKLTGVEYNNDATRYTAGDLIYPYRNDMGDRNAPKRLPYCYSSANINSNVPAQPDIKTTPVFWDK